MHTPLDLKTQVLSGSRPGVKIGVVADTRENTAGLKVLLDRFLVAGVRWLFHCGGIALPDTIELLKPWQIYMVRGEREPNWQAIEAALQKARLRDSLPTEVIITLENRRIGMCRGDDQSVVNRWVKSGGFDYIFHGSTLRQRNEKVGRTRIINPGALSGPNYKNRSGCVIDLGLDEVKFIDIEK
jgi:uncharacterized protein